MSSINDVLKKKFGVNGSNIAETLSKITPGEGGGSGSGGNWLTVNVVEVESGMILTRRLDKTAGQIIEAYPFVLFCETTTYSDYPNYRSSKVIFGCDYTCDPDHVDDVEDYAPYVFSVFDESYVCDSSSDYPTVRHDGPIM